MRLDGALREVAQVLMVENVELVQARVEEAVGGSEDREEEGEDAQVANGEAAAAAGLLLA